MMGIFMLSSASAEISNPISLLKSLSPPNFPLSLPEIHMATAAATFTIGTTQKGRSLSHNLCSIASSKTAQGIKRFDIEFEDKLQSRSNIALPSLEAISRRHLLVGIGASFCYGLSPFMASAEEKSANKEENDKGVIGAIESLFDPNEKTKSGKVLPKAYLNSARELVKTLRESVNESPDDIAKFRRTADAAKESIREYLGSWRGQRTVVQEESYDVLVKAIRSLANFYSTAGPSAPLPEEVKSQILDYLNTAEEFL